MRDFFEICIIFTNPELEENACIIGRGGINLILDTESDNDGGGPRIKIQSLSKVILLMSENELSNIFWVRDLDI